MFEVDQHQAFLRRLVPAVLSSSAGCSFLFRPPDTGNKSDAWRRSGVAFVHWPLPALPAFAGDSFARLRFKAAIRSITGEGSMTARGLIKAFRVLANDRHIEIRDQRVQLGP